MASARLFDQDVEKEPCLWTDRHQEFIGSLTNCLPAQDCKHLQFLLATFFILGQNRFNSVIHIVYLRFCCLSVEFCCHFSVYATLAVSTDSLLPSGLGCPECFARARGLTGPCLPTLQQMPSVGSRLASSRGDNGGVAGSADDGRSRDQG